MDALKMQFVDCSILSKKIRAGAFELLEILENNGAVFLKTHRGPLDKKPDRQIDERGNIVVSLGVEHALLGKEEFHNRFPPPAPKLKHGAGRFSYCQASRAVHVIQALDERKPGHWNSVADGQVAFGRLLYGLLRPRFGCIDELVWDDSNSLIVKGQPRFFGWANFFGPKLVAKIGKDFLRSAPGWRSEELEDGGILYVIEQQFHKWHLNPSSAVVDYLKSGIPRIKPFRAKPVRLPPEISRMMLIDETTGETTVAYERPRRAT
jgi:hypothetical protein